MIVTFYKTKDNKNVINKTLSDGTEFNLAIRSDTDLENPVLKMATDVTAFNYCYIPYFNRFYFVERVTRSGKLFHVELSSDVLETYKSEILASNAQFRRNLKTGDFANVMLETSNLTTLDKFQSNKTLTDEKSIILSAVGVL